MTCGAFVYNKFKKTVGDNDELVWTTTPSQNKIKKKFLSKRIMPPPILKCWTL